MGKPIGVGDLVMMVRGHSCTLNKYGGVPFVVKRINNPSGGGWYCHRCGIRNAGPNEPGATPYVTNDSGLPLSWLIRIEPLGEDEKDQGKELVPVLVGSERK